MNEEQISRLLAELPRREASPYFTAGVLHRIRRREENRPRPRARFFAVMATLASILLAAILGFQQVQQHRTERKERREAIARLESLETRKQALESEIQSLRRLTRDAQPIVYLGSTPNLDVVVDLRSLARRQAMQDASRKNPASIRYANHGNSGR